MYHLHETGVISTIRVRDSSVEAKLVGNSDDAIVLRAPGVLCLAGVGLVNVLTGCMDGIVDAECILKGYEGLAPRW